MLRPLNEDIKRPPRPALLLRVSVPAAWGVGGGRSHARARPPRFRQNREGGRAAGRLLGKAARSSHVCAFVCSWSRIKAAGRLCLQRAFGSTGRDAPLVPLAASAFCRRPFWVLPPGVALSDNEWGQIGHMWRRSVLRATLRRRDRVLRGLGPTAGRVWSRSRPQTGAKLLWSGVADVDRCKRRAGAPLSHLIGPVRRGAGGHLIWAFGASTGLQVTTAARRAYTDADAGRAVRRSHSHRSNGRVVVRVGYQ